MGILYIYESIAIIIDQLHPKDSVVMNSMNYSYIIDSARKKLLAQSRLHGQGQQLTLQQSFRRGRKRSPPEIFIQAYLFLFLIFIHFIFNLFLRYFMELAELSVGTSPGEGRKRGTVGLMLWPAKNKELIITGKQLRSVQACLACMRCPSLRFKRQVLK